MEIAFGNYATINVLNKIPDRIIVFLIVKLIHSSLHSGSEQNLKTHYGNF